ncbi:MAG: glycosyltransferase [Gemmatimonadales bacterium]|nr:MAG: glycosyltransferase [Gemmatimonadales bacterium]
MRSMSKPSSVDLRCQDPSSRAGRRRPADASDLPKGCATIAAGISAFMRTGADRVRPDPCLRRSPPPTVERESAVDRRIIGIALLRNEENFVAWSLANVAGFCDELIVVDNGSMDQTAPRLEALRGRFPWVTVHRTEDPNTSHRFVEGFAGERVWVIGVDGDEVYDPEGLSRLRPRILAGEFDRWWSLAGHSLHTTSLDPEGGRATGYPTPPAPSVTKLYNFGALASWKESNRERLHGNGMKFRKGWSRSRVLHLDRAQAWESCDLRLLHLCFFRRSSEDPENPLDRPNPSEVRAGPIRRAHIHLKNFLRNPLSGDASYKVRRYRRGVAVEREIESFGRPADWASVDPNAAATESMLGGS